MDLRVAQVSYVIPSSTTLHIFHFSYMREHIEHGNWLIYTNIAKKVHAQIEVNGK